MSCAPQDGPEISLETMHGYYGGSTPVILPSIGSGQEKGSHSLVVPFFIEVCC